MQNQEKHYIFGIGNPIEYIDLESENLNEAISILCDRVECDPFDEELNLSIVIEVEFGKPTKYYKRTSADNPYNLYNIETNEVWVHRK